MKSTTARWFLVVTVLALAVCTVSCALAEDVVVPFSGGTSAASTTLSYSGDVWIMVSGTGTVAPAPSPINDAFYVFTDPNAVEITPLYPDPATIVDSGILCINGLPAQSSIPSWVGPPAYDASHQYVFLASVPSGTITFGAYDGGDLTDNTGSYTVSVATAANAKITPKTLNLRSGGRWVTASITLPQGMDPRSIVRSSVLLGGVVPAAERPWSASARRLMVKFSRADVAALLTPGENVVTISGELTDGSAFLATATIRATNPGNGQRGKK